MCPMSCIICLHALHRWMFQVNRKHTFHIPTAPFVFVEWIEFLFLILLLVISRYSAHYLLLPFSYYFEHISFVSIQFNSFISRLFDSGLHFTHTPTHTHLPFINPIGKFSIYMYTVHATHSFSSRLSCWSFRFYFLIFSLPFSWLSHSMGSVVVWFTRSCHVSHFRLIFIAINVCPSSIISRHNMPSTNFVIK